ncbi:Vam6/Vps39 protein, partial [Fasciolopsis buskii]
MIIYVQFQDVVMLYQSHGIHRKALSVLQQLGLVRLKTLGIIPPETPMLTAHSVDLPNIDPQTVDPSELEHLGHPRTMTCCGGHKYSFHSLLFLSCRFTTSTRIRSFQPTGKVFANRVCEEQQKTGTVARLRRRLLRFLQHPDAAYSPAKLLAKCPYDGLFEERALLLASLKNHEQALTLWVHVLNDWDQAVSHCVSVYEHTTKTPNALNTAVANDPEKYSRSTIVLGQNPLHSSTLTSFVSHSPARDSIDDHGQELSKISVTTDFTASVEQDIFFLLVLVCMEPPDPASLGILLEDKRSETEAGAGETGPNTRFQPKPDRALEVLKRFGDRVDASKVVRILPSVRLFDVMHYLKVSGVKPVIRLGQVGTLKSSSVHKL